LVAFYNGDFYHLTSPGNRTAKLRALPFVYKFYFAPVLFLPLLTTAILPLRQQKTLSIIGEKSKI
jgi:hypothetical protein